MIIARVRRMWAYTGLAQASKFSDVQAPKLATASAIRLTEAYRYGTGIAPL